MNEITASAELIPRAEAIAQKIIANAPLAVQYAMEAVNHGMEMTLAEGLYLEAALFGVCCATEDKLEGTTAFLEKRAPNFKGNRHVSQWSWRGVCRKRYRGPEPWLQGTLTDVPAVPRAVFHALELPGQDLRHWCGDLTMKKS